MFLVLSAPIAVASDPPADPVLQDVYRLLDAGMAERTILEYLETSGLRPRPLTPDDLIGLKDAGAGEEFISALLRMSAQPETPSPPPTPVAAGTPVDFRVQYRAAEDGDDGAAEAPWNLYLYLDGNPLTFAAGGSGTILSDGIEFTERLAPGMHTLRVTQERHTLEGERWWHETRACPDPIAFEVRDGEPLQLAVRYTDDGFAPMGWKGPLDWKLERDGARIDGADALGGFSDGWKPLCEDLEANVEPGKKPGGMIRRELKRCVRWSALWPDGTVTDRADVLGRLAELDFQPMPVSAD